MVATPDVSAAGVQAQVEAQLAQLLDAPEDGRLDHRWAAAQAVLKDLAFRRSKRVRPLLTVAGFELCGGPRAAMDGVLRFAAGAELLHTFMLIHDDVADSADTRRGGPSLHRSLASGKHGMDLAVVVGDYAFARAVEAMLCSGLPGSRAATTHYLAVCRHTAVGQYLDLDFSQRDFNELTLFDTLKVANLKTARYGFAAPLVAGALLAGAAEPVVEALERVGRLAGVAYQLRDDVNGLCADPQQSGKPADSDLKEGKRTFPVMAAWLRANPAQRDAMTALWANPTKSPQQLSDALALITQCGGLAAAERAIARATQGARRALFGIPGNGTVKQSLEQFIVTLATRQG